MILAHLTNKLNLSWPLILDFDKRDWRKDQLRQVKPGKQGSVNVSALNEQQRQNSWVWFEHRFSRAVNDPRQGLRWHFPGHFGPLAKFCLAQHKVSTFLELLPTFKNQEISHTHFGFWASFENDLAMLCLYFFKETTGWN